MRLILLFLLLLSSAAYAQWDSTPVRIVPSEGIATSDTVTITAADTEQRLPDVGTISSVVLKPRHTNVDRVFISGTSDSSTLSFSLATKDSVVLDIDDLSDIFVRSKTSGEKVEYFCLK